MSFKNFEGKLLLRVLLLLVTLSTPSVALVNGWAELLVFLVPLLMFQVYELYHFLKKAQEELNLFIEAIQYRDFSRYFSEKPTSPQLLYLRKGFNQINTTFKAINQEKETQHQHLQRILELVETGILSYDLESGEVVLLNESLKKLLQVPYLRSVRTLEKRDPSLYAQICALAPGPAKIVLIQTPSLERSTYKFMLSATVFQNEGRRYKLVAFQNVNDALEETESEAWQKLLNVMTHEIMNSIAPISSLADTLKDRLQATVVGGVSSHDLEDLEEGISTIKYRSQGLLKFAQTYRNLSKITHLHQEKLLVEDIFLNLRRLMHPSLAQKNISLQLLLHEPHLTIEADPNLLDQVLINLLVNAMDAVKEQPEPQITLAAYSAADGKVVLKVTDNGVGMPKEIQEKIFIPFFSSKKNGSGIGLSLCKQIIMLHKGTIQVQSEEGKGTTFTLLFRH
ncbi:PAS domain-containing sensor histidine kinase [Rufibacter glacialis]|uniref:histidine kinase n=1 Tax=Rufibacter glacialis TaxID=1259555 RepID=A0A5M8Q7D2_9BACT|nr:HAMP domain-containing sensor histidine kinase [Rufibacter glacialis]KAA6431835.1 HAMP domain-containing histidine kinase [Rufibacter glacialis]GGK81134.1 histidine kinase [Rufibacter glacialis]